MKLVLLIALFFTATATVTNEATAMKHGLKPLAPGWGFSGSGLFLPYLLGSLTALNDYGVVKRNTLVAGTSGGSYTAALNCAGINGSHAFTTLQNVFAKCAADPGCLGQGLGGLTELYLQAVIPKDVQKRCNKYLFVHISQCAVEDIPADDPLCINQQVANITAHSFENRADVVSALKASSFVAGTSKAGKCSTKFRGKLAYDGGYTVELPCPQDAKKTVLPCQGVAAVPKEAWAAWAAAGGPKAVFGGNAVIYPGIRGTHTLVFPASSYAVMMFNFTTVTQWPQLFAAGRDDAAFWATSNGFDLSASL